jgi:DNA polymerase III alpha subunit
MEKNSILTRLVHEIKSQPIIERLEQEKNNRFLEHECSIVLSAPENISYYNHIIVNKNILSENTINSYIMWIYGIVDQLDNTRPIQSIPARIQMPDIDIDIPIDKREQVLEYIKSKYGHGKVSQMITFNTMKGRGALKDVLRVYGNISFEEMNSITKFIPDEAKIADELQEMKEDTGEASIIRWALENNTDKLKEWCYIAEDGSLAGPLSKRFEQAIRLEGTKSNQSKHAAGVIIGTEDLASLCPMVYDNRNDQLIAGMEMNDLESLGLIKFDILGIAYLDKIMSVSEYLKNGEL